MPYRDVDALLARIEHLEAHRSAVVARGRRLARKRRRRQLVLALLVVPLLVPVAFVTFATRTACGCTAPRGQARIDVRTLAPVAEKWRIDHDGRCPTVRTLLQDGEIRSSSKITDPWGMPYEILCDADSPRVVSSGPDRRLGNEDDVDGSEPSRSLDAQHLVAVHEKEVPVAAESKGWPAIRAQRE